jgi:hypothetical protein
VIKEKLKRGRPSSITIQIDKKELNVADGNIKQLFKSKIRKFQKSGAYIPLSQEYEDHDVFVIVLETKNGR